MKTFFKVLFLSLLLLVMASFPTLAMEYNELLNLPTADLIRSQGYLAGEMNNEGNRNLEGIYRIENKLQIGGMITYNSYSEAELGVSIKALLSPESENEPAVAAGIKNRDLYVVISKNLAYGFRGHLGLGNGGLNGLFVGFNKVLNPVTVQSEETSSLPVMMLMGEYVQGQINLGVRTALQENLSLELGVMNFDNINLGLGFSF